MAAYMKPGWSKPSTILFASEIPANEKGIQLCSCASQGICRGPHPVSRL
jgi:hypothetical protein